VHESAEEQIVHPAARHAFNDGKNIVDSRLHEENEAKQALVALDQMGVEHPDFDQRLNALSRAVTEHAAHEEGEEFPQLRKALPPDRLRQMAGAFEAAEAVAPTRPHPKVGESATANLVAGPPTAIFDRVRDAMRDWQANKGKAQGR
jgi:hemerythrin superfamily protein